MNILYHALVVAAIVIVAEFMAWIVVKKDWHFLRYANLSIASDIWNFGLNIVEFMTLGLVKIAPLEVPFPKKSSNDSK